MVNNKLLRKEVAPNLLILPKFFVNTSHRHFFNKVVKAYLTMGASLRVLGGPSQNVTLNMK